MIRIDFRFAPLICTHGRPLQHVDSDRPKTQQVHVSPPRLSSRLLLGIKRCPFERMTALFRCSNEAETLENACFFGMSPGFLPDPRHELT